MLDDERFFAWLDGELSETEAREVEAIVAADPALTQRAEEHRALQEKLHSVFDTLARPPAHLTQGRQPGGDGQAG